MVCQQCIIHFIVVMRLEAPATSIMVLEMAVWRGLAVTGTLLVSRLTDARLLKKIWGETHGRKENYRGILMDRKLLRYQGPDSMTQLHRSQSHTRAISCCLMLPWVGIGLASLMPPLWMARLYWRSIIFACGTRTERQGEVG